MKSKETMLRSISIIIEMALRNTDDDISLHDIELAVMQGIEDAGHGSFYVDIHK